MAKRNIGRSRTALQIGPELGQVVERTRPTRYLARPFIDGPSRTAHTRWPRMEHQSGLAGAPALEERPRARISVDDQFVRTLTSPRTRSPCWRSRRRVSPIPRLRGGSTKFERKEVSANSAFRNIRSSRKILGRTRSEESLLASPSERRFRDWVTGVDSSHRGSAENVRNCGNAAEWPVV